METPTEILAVEEETPQLLRLNIPPQHGYCAECGKEMRLREGLARYDRKTGDKTTSMMWSCPSIGADGRAGFHDDVNVGTRKEPRK